MDIGIERENLLEIVQASNCLSSGAKQVVLVNNKQLAKKLDLSSGLVEQLNELNFLRMMKLL